MSGQGLPTAGRKLRPQALGADLNEGVSRLMPIARRKYKAMISSDWSECLSPNGPFDPIAYNYPNLTDALEQIFRQVHGKPDQPDRGMCRA